MKIMYNCVAVSSLLDDFTDEELLYEYRTFGSSVCFEELVIRYRSSLASYLRSRFGLNADELDDVLQDTFARVIEKVTQFDVSLSFRNWIYTIARSRTVDMFRRSKRDNQSVSLDSNGVKGEVPWSENLEGDAPDPAEEVENRDLVIQARHIVSKLPVRYRDVIEMVYFRGMTCQSAATALNLASATVSRRIHRALELMRAALSA